MTARALTTAAACALTLACAPAAGAMEMDHGAAPAAPAGGGVVSIPGKYFSPARIVVLAGHSVTWRNEDASMHNIDAPDGSIDSGRLSPGGAFTATFTEPGVHPYLCTIHRSMRGTVEVVAVDLSGPTTPVAPGASVTLRSESTPGLRLTLERVARGAATETVAGAVADADGHASFALTADRPGLYRVRSGELLSRIVSVRVAPKVTLTARRSGRVVRVRATVRPVARGAMVMLASYVRERFAYVPFEHGSISADGRASWTLRDARRLRLQAIVAPAGGGFAAAHSAAVVVPRARH